MKRRDVLKSAGALAGAALLPDCGPGAKGAGKIDTVVYLMMENRSYDHLMGARSMLEAKPGDGLTAQMSNPDADGMPCAVFAAPSGALCVPDPPHSWDPSHAQWNAGANDGFLKAQQGRHPGDVSVMQYQTRVDQPVTWALADSYASCDRWFASVMGPTWPNRFYFLTGTSVGQKTNTTPQTYGAPTIFGRLDQKGIDYRIYYSDLPFASLLGEADFQLNRHLMPLDTFFADARAGKLPRVSYIDPPFTSSDDHPPHHPILGQQFVASIYNALAQSPQWERCLFLITYDEHGGFFDHVSPPKTEDDYAALGFDQLGFRVPAIAVGPYVKQGHLSSVVRNHTSALKQLETLFGTAPLSKRSTAAADLSELLDLDRLARGEPRMPVAIPAVDVSQWVIDDACSNGIHLQHDVLRIADEHPELIKPYDLRPRLRETLELIARNA